MQTKKNIFMFVNKGKFWFVVTLFTLSAGATLLTDLSAKETRVRKSIDKLTAGELTDYIHAVKKLQEKSTKDPSVQFSYAHMAGLHNIPNLFKGACEHWNYRFLAWHRALLLNYEDALRASDPPRTSKVTIPYWNWTVEPSGQCYPVAFENNAIAVEDHYKRRVDPAYLQILFKSNRGSSECGPIYDWSNIDGIAREHGPETFLGTEFDHGALENPPHDEMHGVIGGDLVHANTAANDPIFWSFHAFVDLIWWYRQREITDIVQCGDCSLNGMKAKTAGRTNGPTLVSDVTDSLAQLGVTYEFAQAPLQTMATETRNQRLSTRLPWHAAKALEKPHVLRQFKTKIPATDDSVFVVQLVRVQIPTTLAYIALVFVHPSNVPFAQGSLEFRDRYLVGHFGQWANLHVAHMADVPTTRNFRVDVDRDIYPELLLKTGTHLTVSVAIHVLATDNAELRSTMAAGVANAGTNVAAIIERETAVGAVIGTVKQRLANDNKRRR